MLHIYIDTIPHSEQRYPTVGDYWEADMGAQVLGGTKADPQIKVTKSREVRISSMENEDYEFLVAIHELIEQHLCKKRGISEERITSFDMLYEQNRPAGDVSEPGNDTRAPYYHEHQFATSIEMQIAAALGVDWDVYDKTVNSL
ncbi:MAG: hypothetical protein P4L77_12205 [Sulfuriferula sp.]|nr:hypothetical protein [Sulfuriferula sp.]